MSMSGAKIGLKATITNPAKVVWLIQRVQRKVKAGRASCAAGGGSATPTSAVLGTATPSPQAARTTISVAVSRGLRKTSPQRFLPNVVVCPAHRQWKVFRQSLQTFPARRSPEVLTHRRAQKKTQKNRPKKTDPKKTDREGFEPTESASTFGGLVNRCLKPLGHLSKNFAANFAGNSNWN